MARETLWPLKFEEVTKCSTVFRQLNGSCPTIVTYNKMWWFKNIFWPSYSFFCFYIATYSVINDVKKKNFADAIRNVTMSIVALTVMFKHLLLLRYRKSIKEIIDIINKHYEEAKDLIDDEKDIILRYARLGMSICKFWLVIPFVTGLMFPVRAVYFMIYSYCKGEFELVPVMDLSYPFVDEYKDEPIVFCFLFLSCICFDIYSFTVYTAFEPLVPVIVTHTCGQLELINIRLLNIFSNASSIEDIHEKLKRINNKMLEIYSIIDAVQKNFVLLYEFTMKTTTFLIPFSAFQIVEGLKRTEISMDFGSFFLGSILHFYSPCYFSNLLMEKSELLRQAIYSCGWEMQPNSKARKTILLMQTRTTKSLVIRTVFMPICLDTFAEMSRQAYAIYNIMHAAWG